MLLFPTALKIHLAIEPVDMRKQFNGLWTLTSERLREDPRQGAAFVFTNKHKDRIKILYWDGTGPRIFSKRLEKGRFTWPASRDTTKLSLAPEALAMLLAGIDLRTGAGRHLRGRCGAAEIVQTRDRAPEIPPQGRSDRSAGDRTGAAAGRAGRLRLGGARRLYYGYRCITALLRRAGCCVNAKRVQRLRREHGLQTRKKQRRMKCVGESTAQRRRASRPNEVWSWDFVHDQTEYGSRFRILTFD